ncbi:unnamed protein product [Boreogadus saida]
MRHNHRRYAPTTTGDTTTGDKTPRPQETRPQKIRPHDHRRYAPTTTEDTTPEIPPSSGPDHRTGLVQGVRQPISDIAAEIGTSQSLRSAEVTEVVLPSEVGGDDVAESDARGVVSRSEMSRAPEEMEASQ